jgi:tRNA(adenine34) deaminase
MHEAYMRRCLALAEQAAAQGDTPVGALVVRHGAIIGEGFESTRSQLDPGAHAEALAIRAACRHEQSLDLSGSTVYSTVEPCVLCGYALRRSAVSRLVYGIPAGQAGGLTSRYAILSDRDLTGWPPPPVVIAGVLADECVALLRRRPAARE